MILAMDVAQMMWTAVIEHPYLLLGPLVLAEGPAATVLAGSLVGAGLAAFWPILLIVVGADVLADSLLFTLGRFGNRPVVARLLRRLGLTGERRVRLTVAVARNLPKVVIGAKAVDIAAVPAYLAAGLAGIPYRRFVSWIAAASAVRAGVLVGVGILFGRTAAGLLDSPVTGLLLTVVLALTVGAGHLLVRRLAGRRLRTTV
jgi:membrane protein DedA with SNARE-associated domain